MDPSFTHVYMNQFDFAESAAFTPKLSGKLEEFQFQNYYSFQGPEHKWRFDVFNQITKAEVVLLVAIEELQLQAAAYIDYCRRHSEPVGRPGFTLHFQNSKAINGYRALWLSSRLEQQFATFLHLVGALDDAIGNACVSLNETTKDVLWPGILQSVNSKARLRTKRDQAAKKELHLKFPLGWTKIERLLSFRHLRTHESHLYVHVTLENGEVFFSSNYQFFLAGTLPDAAITLTDAIFAAKMLREAYLTWFLGATNTHLPVGTVSAEGEAEIRELLEAVKNWPPLVMSGPIGDWERHARWGT